MEEEIKPENETPQNLISRIFDWIWETKESILKVGTFFILLSGLIFWISKNKEPQIVGEIENFVAEHKECLQDDVITGEVRVKGKIKKAALFSLTVFSRFQKESKTIIPNEIAKQNGTFKFSFCKATTKCVEFIVSDLKHEDYIKQYPVDSIPTIVDFQ